MPYHHLLDPFLRGVPQQDYLCMASEGVMAIPLLPETSGGVLATSIHYYEFIPVEDAEHPNPRVILPENAEVGCTYGMVLSTTGGLYRYNIGDVVRVTGFAGRTPTVEFLHRVGRTCSLTGEKLTEDQVSIAVERTGEALSASIESFTMQPAPSGFPRYVLLAELTHVPKDGTMLRKLSARLDLELGRVNMEYRSKRASERLGAPEVWLVRRGEYRRWRDSQWVSNTSDDQVKPIHLTRNSTFYQQFKLLVLDAD